MDLAAERALRQRLMDALADRLAVNGSLTRAELSSFAAAGDQARRLIDTSKGIWNPRELAAKLTVMSSPAGPYDDTEVEGGWFRYSYRAGSVEGDNAKLRRALELRQPIILLWKIDAGVYVPVFPVYVAAGDVARREFVLALDESLLLVPDALHPTDAERSYAERVVRQRLHQPMFRGRVLRAYETRCAVCRLAHGELLDAARITADSAEGGLPVVTNGLALCKIHHAAYDRDLMGVSPDLRVHINQRLLDEVDGPMLRHGLQDMHGTSLTVPTRRADHRRSVRRTVTRRASRSRSSQRSANASPRRRPRVSSVSHSGPSGSLAIAASSAVASATVSEAAGEGAGRRPDEHRDVAVHQLVAHRVRQRRTQGRVVAAHRAGRELPAGVCAGLAELGGLPEPHVLRRQAEQRVVAQRRQQVAGDVVAVPVEGALPQLAGGDPAGQGDGQPGLEVARNGQRRRPLERQPAGRRLPQLPDPVEYLALGRAVDGAAARPARLSEDDLRGPSGPVAVDGALAAGPADAHAAPAASGATVMTGASVMTVGAVAAAPPRRGSALNLPDTSPHPPPTREVPVQLL
jgi:putative restriction endonuclease